MFEVSSFLWLTPVGCLCELFKHANRGAIFGQRWKQSVRLVGFFRMESIARHWELMALNSCCFSRLNCGFCIAM